MAVNVDDIFLVRGIYSASDEELDELVKVLSSYQYSDRDSGREGKDVRRLIATTAVKNQRHIDKIEERNKIYTCVIILLTISSIFVQVYEILYK